MNQELIEIIDGEISALKQKLDNISMEAHSQSFWSNIYSTTNLYDKFNRPMKTFDDVENKIEKELAREDIVKDENGLPKVVRHYEYEDYNEFFDKEKGLYELGEMKSDIANRLENRQADNIKSAKDSVEHERLTILKEILELQRIKQELLEGKNPDIDIDKILGVSERIEQEPITDYSRKPLEKSVKETSQKENKVSDTKEENSEVNENKEEKQQEQSGQKKQKQKQKQEKKESEEKQEENIEEDEKIDEGAEKTETDELIEELEEEADKIVEESEKITEDVELKDEELDLDVEGVTADTVAKEATENIVDEVVTEAIEKEAVKNVVEESVVNNAVANVESQQLLNSAIQATEEVAMESAIAQQAQIMEVAMEAPQIAEVAGMMM